ncbi:MAG: hypothetical protein ACYTFT_04435 [Planctomycetota bacterium]
MAVIWITEGLFPKILYQQPWEIEIVAGSGPLGGLYVLSDSIAVAACVHALHDVVGFSVFALQRRTRWFL